MTRRRGAGALRGSHDREIAALAIPALGTLVADPVLSLVDTAFVGRLGSAELAGLGVAVAVFSVAFFVFNFLEYGTTALIARAVGSGDREGAGRSVILAFGTAGVAGLGAIAVLEILVGPIVGALGAGGEVRDVAVTYIRIRALAAPAVLAVRAGHGAYRGFQDTRTPFGVTLGINAVNLALDPLLIFGAGWGIAGAAWATVAAQWVGAVWFVVLILGRDRDRLGIVPGRPDPGELRAFLRIGRDLAVRTGSLLAMFTLSSAVATRVSDTAIAAHQVVMQIWLLLSLALDALAIAAQALVGRFLGERRFAAATGITDRVVVIGVGVGVLLAAVLALGGPVVPGWFTSDARIVDAIGSVWPFLVLQQPLNGAVFGWDGAFIGAGDFAYLAVMMLVSSVAGAAVLAGVLPFGWGLPGVWWAMTALMGVRAVTLAWRRAAPGSPLRAP